MKGINLHWNSINDTNRKLMINDAFMVLRNICICTNNKIHLNLTNHEDVLERWKEGPDEKSVNYFLGKTGLPFQHNIHHSFSEAPWSSEVASDKTIENEIHSIEKLLGQESIPCHSLQVTNHPVECSSQSVDEQTSVTGIKEEPLQSFLEKTESTNFSNVKGLSQEKCVSSVETPGEITSTNKVNKETEDLDSRLLVHELERLINEEAYSSAGRKKFNGLIPTKSNCQNPVRESIKNKSIGLIGVQNYTHAFQNKLRIWNKNFETQEIPDMWRSPEIKYPKINLKTNNYIIDNDKINEISNEIKSPITTLKNDKKGQKSMKPFAALSSINYISENQLSFPPKNIGNPYCLNTETERSSSNQLSSSSLSLNNILNSTMNLNTERTRKNQNIKHNICQRNAPFQNIVLNNTNYSRESSKKCELESKYAQNASKTVKYMKINNPKYCTLINRYQTTGKSNISTIPVKGDIENKVSNLLEDVMSRRKSYNKKVIDIISCEKFSKPISNIKRKSDKNSTENKNITSYHQTFTKSLVHPAKRFEEGTSNTHSKYFKYKKINKRKTSPRYLPWNALLTKQCLNKDSSVITPNKQPMDANGSTSTIVYSPSVVRYQKQNQNKSNLCSKFDLKSELDYGFTEAAKMHSPCTALLAKRCNNKSGKFHPKCVFQSSMKNGNKSAKMYSTDILKLIDPIENEEANMHLSIVSKNRNQCKLPDVNLSLDLQSAKIKRTESTVNDDRLSCVSKLNDCNFLKLKTCSNVHIKELETPVIQEAYNKQSNFLKKGFKNKIINWFLEKNSLTYPRPIKYEVKPNRFNIKGDQHLKDFSIKSQNSFDTHGLKLVDSKKCILFHRPNKKPVAFIKKNIYSKSNYSYSEINKLFPRDPKQLQSDHFNLPDAEWFDNPNDFGNNINQLSETPLKKARLQNGKTILYDEQENSPIDLTGKYKKYIDSSFHSPPNILPNKYFTSRKSKPNLRSLAEKTIIMNKCNTPSKHLSLKNFIRQPSFKTKNLESINKIIESHQAYNPGERKHNSLHSGFYFTSPTSTHRNLN